MSYYEMIEEDLKRAKEILEKGRTETPSPDQYAGARIDGADIYAAYKLLESFVAEIEDFQRSFELYDRSSLALMAAYKRVHPEVPEQVWPDAAVVDVWAAEEIERLRPELRQFLGLFSDYEEPCESFAQAEAIWNDLKAREGRLHDEIARLRALVDAVGGEKVCKLAQRTIEAGRQYERDHPFPPDDK